LIYKLSYALIRVLSKKKPLRERLLEEVKKLLLSSFPYSPVNPAAGRR
jgi:hypothetical protein